MVNIKLVRAEKAEFDFIYDAMEDSFPVEERRDKAAAMNVLSEPQFSIWHTEENGKKVGFITLWELDGFTFVEHFVTYKQYRGQGYGSKVLNLLKEKENIVLEVELPETEIAVRRIGFYERCGFSQNDYPYAQPSYREGGKSVDMILMSYPEPLKEPDSVVDELYRKVYKCK